MGLNKKSQMAIVSIMVAIIILIVAVVLIEPVNTNIETAMNDTALNCSTTTNTYTSITCNILDLSLFYFIGVALSIGLAFVAGNKNISGVVTGITVFIVVMLMITPITDWIITARDSDNLDCQNSSISIGARMTCIFVDIWLFYFVVVAIAAGLSYGINRTITSKRGQ